MAAAVETNPVSIPRVRRVPDRFRTVTAVVATTAPVVLVLIIAILLQQAWPAVTHFGPAFLSGVNWNPVTESFGALPAIFGTVTTSFLALVISVPIGVAVAVFLAEQGQQTIRGVIGTGIELLAATGEDTPVGRFLAKQGPGLHHVAYQVTDIEATLRELRSAGMQLIDEQPRTGIRGSRVAFLHPRSTLGVLTEIVQPAEVH